MDRLTQNGAYGQIKESPRGETDDVNRQVKLLVKLKSTIKELEDALTKAGDLLSKHKTGLMPSKERVRARSRHRRRSWS